MKTFSSRSFSVVGCVSAFFVGLATSYSPANTPIISLDVEGGGSWQWNPSGYTQGSDGVWEPLQHEDLREALSREPTEAARTLVARAYAAGGTDNMTAAVLRVEQAVLAQEIA